MIAKVRELDVANHHVHGLNRRPSRADRTPLDLAAIVAWNRRQERCKDAYADTLRRAACPLPHVNGGWCVCRTRRSS